MPGDLPTELVNRAYDVGAFATAVPAVPADLPDRRGLIRALGIVQIVFGGILGLVVIGSIVMVAVIARRPAVLIASAIYALPAANLLVTGIASVRIARWARRATLISAGIWLVLMLLAVVALFVGPGHSFPATRGEMTMVGLVMVPMLLIAVGLPIVLLVVYTRPSVRATFERRQAS